MLDVRRHFSQSDQILFSSKNELTAVEQKIAAAKRELAAAERKLDFTENKWRNSRGESEKTHYFKGMKTAQAGVDTDQNVVDYYAKKLWDLDSNYNQVL